MKKYIILAGLCILASIKAGAVNQPQDTIRPYAFSYNFDMDDFDWEAFNGNMETFNEKMQKFNKDHADWSKHFSYEVNDSVFASFGNLKIDTAGFSKLRGMALKLNFDMDEFNERMPKFKKGVAQSANVRTENRTFSNIARVIFNHSYGHITVEKSNSKLAKLKIQYIDAGGKKGVVSTSVANKTLTINTSGTSQHVRVNYIISIPQNTVLNVNLKNGSIEMKDFKGAFSSNLTYSNLKANSFANSTPVVGGKYSSITIADVPDIVVDASYTQVNIGKVDEMEISGQFNNYTLRDVKSITIGKSAASGKFKIGSIGNISGDMKYADMTINNLTSNLVSDANYSNIKINNISPKSHIDIRGGYSDVTLGMPNNVSASFDVNLTHGTFSVDKKYTVKYTEQSDKSARLVKKGQIGSTKPGAVISISNSYANVRFE